ncbi:8096_t:CDS:1, partial [Gigaspora rosea]
SMQTIPSSLEALNRNSKAIARIANEYYRINDIKMNFSNSELLVLHSKKGGKEPEIKLGTAGKIVKWRQK